MGSRARIVVYATHDPADAVRRAFAAIELYETILSDYDPQSESRRLAASPAGNWRGASAVLIDSLVKSRAAWEASDGAFDVTIGTMTALWRDETGVAPGEKEVDRARERVGMELIEVDEGGRRVRFLRDGMRLDFGGIGKGLAADAALASLRADGLDSALIEIGGDIAAGTPPPGEDAWTLLVEHLPGRPLHTIFLAEEAVATSGDGFRFTLVEGERRSHLFDVASGEAAPPGVAATVIARECWVADALATIAKLEGESAARAAGERLCGPDSDLYFVTSE